MSLSMELLYLITNKMFRPVLPQQDRNSTFVRYEHATVSSVIAGGPYCASYTAGNTQFHNLNNSWAYKLFIKRLHTDAKTAVTTRYDQLISSNT